MARLKVVGIGSTLLLLTVAVAWSALPTGVSRTSSDAAALEPYILQPPGAPATTGVAHEPAAVSTPLQTVSDDAGRVTPSTPERTGGSFLGNAIQYVSRSVESAKKLVTSSPASAIDAPAESGDASKTRWTVVDVPAADVQRLANDRRNGPIAMAAPLANRDGGVTAVDTDADWYAVPEEDAPVAANAKGARSTHGRAAQVRKPLPARDAGNASWYDSLDVSEEPANGAAPVSSLEDSLLAGMDAAAVLAGDSRPSASRAGVPTSGTVRRSRGGAGMAPAMRGLTNGNDSVAACATPATRWRLVKLEATQSEPSDAGVAKARPAPAAPASGLPAPEESEPAVVLASLGPKLSGTGATEFPGLAAPRPEETPKPTSFCPVGLVEKKNKGERFCARVDKTGISFREGPVAFLYPNGKKKAVGTYVNGKLEGGYAEFSSTGKKTAEGTLTKGKKNGEWSFWWDDGKKQSQGSYVNGERNGKWTYWDEKGRRLSEGEIRTVGNVEKKQGSWVFYHPNGNKKSQGSFESGKKNGAWKQFDERGKQVSLVVFRDGEEEIR